MCLIWLPKTISDTFKLLKCVLNGYKKLPLALSNRSIWLSELRKVRFSRALDLSDSCSMGSGAFFTALDLSDSCSMGSGAFFTALSTLTVSALTLAQYCNWLELGVVSLYYNLTA